MLPKTSLLLLRGFACSQYGHSSCSDSINKKAEVDFFLDCFFFGLLHLYLLTP